MLKIVKEEDRYIVSLFQVSKLNTLFSELIQEQLINLVNVPGRKVIFNLKDVRFIDSAGFRTLTKVSEIARSAGSELLFCNISREVQELIDLTEMNDIIAVCACQ